jgi:hypothetical protein
MKLYSKATRQKRNCIQKQRALQKHELQLLQETFFEKMRPFERGSKEAEAKLAAEEQKASEGEHKDGSQQESNELTRDERRKAKKDREKAKHLAQQTEASRNDDKIEVKEGIDEEGGDIVNQSKCKSEGKKDAQEPSKGGAVEWTVEITRRMQYQQAGQAQGYAYDPLSPFAWRCACRLPALHLVESCCLPCRQS